MPKKPAPRPIDPNVKKFLDNHVGADDRGIVFNDVLLEPNGDDWDDGVEDAHVEGWKADLANILQSFLDGWSTVNKSGTIRKLRTGVVVRSRDGRRSHHKQR